MTKNSRRKIAICFHLGYVNRFDEFTPYIDHVIAVCPKYDMYITYREDVPQETVEELCHAKYPTAQVVKVELGCDTGAFLLQVKSMLDAKKEYDYIFKLHTKSNCKVFPTWKEDLLDCIAGSTSRVRKVLRIFHKKPHVGQIGAKRWLLERDINYAPFREICDRNRINTKGYFVGGTIFWMRYRTIKKIFSRIDLASEYKLCEHGKPPEPSYTHSWERIFGLINSTAHYRVKGI